MISGQPIKLLLFLPAKLARSQNLSCIQNCPCCGSQIAAFNKTSGNGCDVTNTSSEFNRNSTDSIVNSNPVIGGWYCNKCKLHLLPDKRKHLDSSSSRLLSTNDSSISRDQSLSRDSTLNVINQSELHSPPTRDPGLNQSNHNSRQLNLRPPVAARNSHADQSRKPKRPLVDQRAPSMLQSNEPVISSDDLKSPLPSSKDDQNSKDSGSARESVNQSPQSPSTSFTEQYDEWESQVTSDFKDLLGKTRDHVLSREKVLKAHQVDLCQRERMLKTREEQVNEKLGRLQESEESLKEKLDRLNMYKDVMLSQLEAKAKQLAKVEHKLHHNSSYVNNNNSVNNGYIGNPPSRLPPEGGDARHTRFYHNNHHKPPPSGGNQQEHNFTVMPPMPDGRVQHDLNHNVTERSRSRQRPESGNQMVMRNQRSRSTSTGTLRRRNNVDHRDNNKSVDTASRDSLLSDGMSSTGGGPTSSRLGMNRLKDKVPPNRPRPNLHLFPPDTDADSDIRAGNLSNDNLDLGGQAQTYHDEITTNLHHPGHGNHTYQLHPPQQHPNLSGYPQHHQDQPHYNGTHNASVSQHAGLYNDSHNASVQQNGHQYGQQYQVAYRSISHVETSGYHETSSYAQNKSADDLTDRTHSIQQNGSDLHNNSMDIIDNRKQPVRYRNMDHNQNYKAAPPLPNGLSNHQQGSYQRQNTNDNVERSMSYRYNNSTAATSKQRAPSRDRAQSRDRKQCYSYHGNSTDNVAADTWANVGPAVPRGRSMDPASHARTDSMYTSASSEVTGVSDRPPLPEYEESLRNRRPMYRATEI